MPSTKPWSNLAAEIDTDSRRRARVDEFKKGLMRTKRVRADELKAGDRWTDTGATIEAVSEPFYGRLLIKPSDCTESLSYPVDYPFDIVLPEPTLADAMACLDELETIFGKVLEDAATQWAGRVVGELRKKYGVEREQPC